MLFRCDDCSTITDEQDIGYSFNDGTTHCPNCGSDDVAEYIEPSDGQQIDFRKYQQIVCSQCYGQGKVWLDSDGQLYRSLSHQRMNSRDVCRKCSGLGYSLELRQQ